MAKSAQIRGSSLNMATWVYIVVALILGFFVPGIEKVLPPGWVSPVSKSTIEAILGAIAAGTITLSGLAFSLVFVLVQFGSATYSGSDVRNRILSPDEFKSLMQHSEGHTRALIATGYYTGMRKGEILSLTWVKVDLASRMIRLNAEDTKR